MKTFLLPISLMLSLLLLTACEPESGNTSSEITEKPATTIQTAHAEIGLMQYWIETVGTLESVNSPRVAAEVSGKIIEILVESGEMVAANQVLLRVDPSSLKLQEQAAKADLKRLSVLIQNEGKRVNRLTDLGKKDYVSRSGLDDANAQLAGYKAQAQAANAQLELVQDQLNRTEIKAPFAAKIDQRLVSLGDYLRPGTPVFTLAETDRLQARLPVPEVAAGKIRSGQLVEVNIATDADIIVETKIQEIQPVITAGARSLVILADVTAAANRYPGATVRARILTGKNAAAILIPSAAIVRRPAGDVVYIIYGNRAEEQVVVRGLHQGSKVEILDGLEGQEQLATDGAGFLSDGSRVRILQ